MMTLVRRLTRSQAGATAIEYALIAGFIALVIIAGVTAVGQTTQANWNKAAAGFPTAS